MRRSVYDLLAAEAAGEPLSARDVKELTLYRKNLPRRTVAILRAFGPGLEVARTTDLQFDATVFRDWLLRDVETKDAPALREIVGVLLTMIEFDSAALANLSGQWRSKRKQMQHAGHQSGSARQKKAKQFLATIAEIKARPPVLTTDADAARRFLKDTDPDWSASPDPQRRVKVDRVTRRIRSARTITGN